MTVEDIAKEAEFGKGTLYQYFENKEEILVFVICRGLEEVCEKIWVQCIEAEDARLALENLIKVYYLFLEEYRNLFVSFVRRQLDGNLAPHMVELVISTHKKKMELMNQVVNRGIEDGILKAVDTGKLVKAIESTVRGFNIQFVTVDRPDSWEEEVELIKDILFTGIFKKE